MPKNNKQQLSEVKLNDLSIADYKARKLTGPDVHIYERRRSRSEGFVAQQIGNVIKRQALWTHKENKNGK